MNKQLRLTVAAAFLAATAAGMPAGAQEVHYTAGSIAEGSTPFLVNTAWANAVNKYVPGHKITVSTVGPATRHMILTAEGKMDFTMSTPNSHRLLYLQMAYFSKIEEGPKKAAALNSIFSYPIGVTQIVARADSGIKTLADIKGKKVFMGPPSSGAARTLDVIIESHTGYKAGKDFEQIKTDWGPAMQGFQDRKFDVMVVLAAPPSTGLAQILLTDKLRMISLEESKFDHPAYKNLAREPGRTVTKINAKKVYGPNMLNEEPILATSSWVELACRYDLPEDAIYKMTKAFWEHLDEAHAMAKIMPDVVNLKNAMTAMSSRIHPGALKYYKEIGLNPTSFIMAPENAEEFRF
jgi:TRAP transporter TAXI family solute receptor